ncbi:MAG TPA: TetR/AcrR family transcriptional regulator [Stellaceae bacterium]|nr:TetR/AcrR family transcriptional regulator [Stellaceae bacterium]
MRTVNPERFEARRRHVREAALACFKRKGFHQASMADICAEAAMSPGNVYRYYDSKEAIIAAICEEDRRQLTQRLERLGQSGNLLDSMLDIAGEAMSASDPEKSKFGCEVLAEAARNERIAEIVQRHNAAIVALCAEAIRRAQALGQVDPGLDAAAASAVLVAAAEGLNTRLALSPGTAPAAPLAAFRVLVQRFLSPREGSSRLG